MKSTSAQQLKHILDWSNLLIKFREIERAIKVTRQERKENDVEHSYMLAMLAWYIVSSRKLNLDLHKIFTYTLAHDLVEAYAGDTYIWDTNKKVHEDKHAREKAAAQRLKKEFPEFKELHDVIEAYETREDAESKFVYALDKLQPLLVIYLDDCRPWREYKISLDQVLENKTQKVAISQPIAEYFEELVKTIKKEYSPDFLVKKGKKN